MKNNRQGNLSSSESEDSKFKKKNKKGRSQNVTSSKVETKQEVKAAPSAEEVMRQSLIDLAEKNQSLPEGWSVFRNGRQVIIKGNGKSFTYYCKG